LDQSHSHLKHWEMQLEFQMPLSAAETNGALLSINFHLQSASLEGLLQRHKIWRLKEGAIWNAQEIFGWNSSFQRPCRAYFDCVCVCVCVCSDTFYIEILTK